jgi:hypothetical protein
MKRFLPILTWMLPLLVCGQVKDSVLTKPNSTLAKPEIFTNGFIDIMNNGQINASARFVRLLIGEPGKFAIPLSFYSGVSANNFQNLSVAGGLRSNDHLVSAYINPLNGLVNISSDGIIFFKRAVTITRTGFLYHIGARILTGYKAGPVTDPQTGKPINFLNNFVTAGFYFQTGAWERDHIKNEGLFWLIIRYHLCYTRPEQINKFLPALYTNGVYTGVSFGFGIEVNNLVNIKAIYYQYIKRPEIDYTLPIYQFSFNYSIR